MEKSVINFDREYWKMITAIVVEDNKEKRKAIVGVLKQHDVRVEEVENVSNAKKLFQSRSFDIAIIDLALPIWEDGDIRSNAGIDLIREINSLDYYHLPKFILALTAHEECLEQSDSLKELGVILDKYDATQDLSPKIHTYVAKAIRNNQQTSFDYDICIIAALEIEAAPFLELLSNVSDCSDFEYQNFLYKKAFLKIGEETLKIAIVTLPRMGLVNSSLFTARSINLLKPKLVIMPGICAGTSKENMDFGDIITAEISWEWQVGKITDNGHKDELYQIEIDEFSKTLIKNYDKLTLKDFWKEESIRPKKAPTVYFGAVVSGSSVVASGGKIEDISKQHRKILGLEMEIYGVYAASRIGWPKPHFFAAKSICDFADSAKEDDYQEYCAGASASYVLSIIKNNFTRIKNIS